MPKLTHQSALLPTPSWEDVEDKLSVDGTDDRWADAFVVKLPGTLKGWIHHIKRRLGVDSSAMAIAFCIPMTDYALHAAEEGLGIQMYGPNGPAESISNEDLRNLFCLPPSDGPRVAWRKNA